jgi:hypothetical protein
VDGAHGSRDSFGFLLAVGCKPCVRPVCAALILFSAIICFLAFGVPRLPEIAARAERIRAQEIAAEYAYYCENFLFKPRGQKYARCVLDLGKFRLKVEKRIADEQVF